MRSRMAPWLEWVRQQMDRPWYPIVLFGCALADVWLVIIPTDGLVIASTLAQPRRWKVFAIFFTLGSALGALSLAWVVNQHGLPWIQHFFPDFVTSSFWITTESWVDSIGLWAVFLIAITPLSQQPAVILAALSHNTLTAIFMAVLFGRLIKYLVMGFLCAHAPEHLEPMARALGFKSEIKKFKKENGS